MAKWKSGFMKDMEKLQKQAELETKPIPKPVQIILDKISNGYWISDLPVLDQKLLELNSSLNPKVEMAKIIAHQECVKKIGPPQLT